MQALHACSWQLHDGQIWRMRQDWLAHHEQMGVEGIHVYVANLDAERARDTFGRGRPGTLHVTLARRHDVSMLEFFQADEGLPTHYYSQVRGCPHAWRICRIFAHNAHMAGKGPQDCTGACIDPGTCSRRCCISAPAGSWPGNKTSSSWALCAGASTTVQALQ